MIYYFVAAVITAIVLSGCSLSYKPDVYDSTINHQSGNKPNVSTDVNLDLRRKQ